MSTSSPPTSLRSPRDYAAILAEPSRERRAASALEACPVNWQPPVRAHVEDAFAKVKAYRQMMDNCAESIRAACLLLPASPTPISAYPTTPSPPWR
ncbi:hypothetical protein [Pseudomonas aeruginosa]|uniref:hypothetical protein n=1 Tax=Pseudomonas aeruginosa TaxID=287 RepID=UPI003D6FC2D9